MDPLTTGIVFTALTGAIGTLYAGGELRHRAQVATLEREKQELRDELRELTKKAADSQSQELEATRLENAELRKSMDQLVARFAGKAVPE